MKECHLESLNRGDRLPNVGRRLTEKVCGVLTGLCCLLGRPEADCQAHTLLGIAEQDEPSTLDALERWEKVAVCTGC